MPPWSGRSTPEPPPATDVRTSPVTSRCSRRASGGGAGSIQMAVWSAPQAGCC